MRERSSSAAAAWPLDRANCNRRNNVSVGSRGINSSTHRSASIQLVRWIARVKRISMRAVRMMAPFGDEGFAKMEL